MPPFTRAFVAIEINDKVRNGLAAVQQTLKETGAHVAWVAPQNIHVSLVFLGDIIDEQIAQISDVLDHAASTIAAFSFDVANLRIFGSPRSPRVIWADMQNVSALKNLQKGIADGIRALGIELETREFVPHITLGRVKSARDRNDLVAAIEKTSRTSFGHVEVSRILLMKSVLHPSGSQYSILHAVSFP